MGVDACYEEEKSTNLFCLVQELYPVKQNDILFYQIGKKFEWAANPDNDHQFKYQFIPVESILRPSFVVPQCHPNYRVNRPNFNDKFYMLDRKYFDRCSEWRERYLLDPNFITSPEEAEELINRNLDRLQCQNNNVTENSTRKLSSNNAAKETLHEESEEEDDEDESDDVSCTTAISEDDD